MSRLALQMDVFKIHEGNEMFGNQLTIGGLELGLGNLGMQPANTNLAYNGGLIAHQLHSRSHSNRTNNKN